MQVFRHDETPQEGKSVGSLSNTHRQVLGTTYQWIVIVYHVETVRVSYAGAHML